MRNITNEDNGWSVENKKALVISAVIVALILMIVYWQPILEIAFVGGMAFGLLFLIVKYHKVLFCQVQKVQQWLFSRFKDNEE